MEIRNASTYVKLFMGLIFIGLILGYTYIQSTDFTAGPEITIVAPAGGILIEDESIVVEGMVERASEVTLNGMPIFTDEDGNFREIILLLNGKNSITIQATDKFDRTTEKVLELIHN